MILTPRALSLWQSEKSTKPICGFRNWAVGRGFLNPAGRAGGPSSCHAFQGAVCFGRDAVQPEQHPQGAAHLGHGSCCGGVLSPAPLLCPHRHFRLPFPHRLPGFHHWHCLDSPSFISCPCHRGMAEIPRGSRTSCSHPGACDLCVLDPCILASLHPCVLNLCILVSLRPCILLFLCP